MSLVAAEAPASEALTQGERFTSTFTAPSKLFEDIHNGHRSWWLPFVFLLLITYLFFGVVIERIGMQQVVQNQIRMSPRAQDRMAQLNPEQLQKAQSASAIAAEGALVASPLLNLITAVLIAGVLLGTVNFALGGRATFGEVLAVTYYAWLPSVFKVVMGIVVLWFQPPETFNLTNFAPTNPAALFLDPASSGAALYTFASQMDIVTIWTLVLLGMGLSTVAGVKRSSGYIAVFGWWIVTVLFRVGVAAAFS